MFFCSYTLQKNGLAKRKHKHIIEKKLALLAQGHLHIEFWDETFHTSFYLINRFPTPILSNKSPLEILFSLKPEYPFLHFFVAFVFLTLSLTIQISLSIGYSPNKKGYKCLSHSKKIFVS